MVLLSSPLSVRWSGGRSRSPNRLACAVAKPAIGPQRPRTDFEITVDHDISADVIIVGSGIAGALLAAQLAGAGIRVAILEAGAKADRADALERFRNALVKDSDCPYPPTPEAMHPIASDSDFWYRQVGPDKFKSTYLKVVGGTTWHWLGTCLRFLPNDFVLKTAYGRGLDWPLSYDEIEPFYALAETEIGVAGDSDEALGSPRSSPYPMPAIQQTYLDK